MEIRSEPGVTIRYFLHCFGTNESTLCGSSVVSSDGLCPPFNAGANQNLFQHLFGIEFHFENHTYVHGFSPFEFTRCFGFHNNLTYCLSHPLCRLALDAAIPSMTSAWVFDQVHVQLVFLRNSNCKIFTPNKWAALRPASNPLSTEPSAPGSHPVSDGLMLIEMIWTALPFGTWSLTLAASIRKH
jgi:hypothetical protein